MLIDVHSHIFPPHYMQRLRQNQTAPRVFTNDGQDFLDIFVPRPGQAGGTGQPVSPAFDSLAAKLAFMAAGGIDHTVLSVGNPWVEFMATAEAIHWATDLNEYLEGACKGSDGRLSGLGIVPMQDVDAALAELDRIAKLPHLRGVVIPAKPLARAIDDPSLLPFWAKAEALGLPIMLHPHYAVGGEDLYGYGPALDLVFGFPFETTIAAARLILAGIPRRFPNLSFVLTHGGGTLPLLAGRLDNYTKNRNAQPPLSADVRRFYCDALVYQPESVRLVTDVMAPGHVMFGTDHPFGAPNVAQLAGMLDAASLSPEAVASVRAAAARTLFRLG